jgi:predicted dehydrogenase
MSSPAPSSNPCRIALLGCGAVSELYHAPALQHLEAQGLATVAALFDPDPARAAKLVELFPKATPYPDESFLENVPLDLAIVASPVSFHEAHATRALAAGIAVLCEKPLANDTASGERMIAAAQKHQRLLAVGLLRRFYSNVQLTRQIIENKTLGAVTGFSIQEGGPFNWPARSDTLFRKSTAGGGVLLDVGVHVLDLVINWFGEPGELTYSDDAMGGLEANCRIDLTYPSGFRGTVLLSRDWNNANLYVIEFERGTLKLRAGQGDKIDLELHNSPLSIEGIAKNQPSSIDANAVPTASHFQEAFLAQLQHIIHVVQTGSRPNVPAEEAIRSLRLIEKCYRTRQLMDMPWLTPPEIKASHALAAGGGK